MRNRIFEGAPVALSVWCGACSVADGGAIVGSWDDNFGSAHEVTSTRWTIDTSSYEIQTWGEDFLTAQNAASNQFSPGLWSRFDWRREGEIVWVCQTVFDGASEEAAASAPAADPSKPAVSGCGGFSWTALRASLPEIGGSFVDGFGGTQVVNAWTWKSGDELFEIQVADVEGRRLLARNALANQLAPEAYSAFDWKVAGGLAFCQTASDAESLDAARDTPRADATDSETGCGGLPWSTLTASE